MSGYDNIIVSYYCIVGITYSVKWVDCNNVVNYFIKKILSLVCVLLISIKMHAMQFKLCVYKIRVDRYTRVNV